MLDDVFFVSMEGKVDYHINEFLVRDDIPLPVLSTKNNSFSPEDITPDNIIMGMLKILKEDPNNEHLDYYRDFIYTVKPDVDGLLTSAAFEAENNEDYIDAIDIYRGLLSLNPDSIDHNLNVAVCYDEYSQHLFQKGRDAEAQQMEEIAYGYFKEIEKIKQFLSFIAKKNSSEAIRLINEIYDDGADLIEFNRAILKNLRKILLLKANPDTENILKEELTEDQLKSLKELVGKFEIKELKKLMEEFLKAKDAIKHSPIPTLPLELIVFEL